MIANLLIFLLTNLENCFFYCEILFDFNYHFAHVFSKENYNLIDQIKSPQQFSEEHSKQQGSNQRPRFNSGRSGRHVSVPPYSESKLSKSVVEKEAPNVFDLRPLKKGESARPICDTSKKFTVILLDGSSYEIPGMPSFKSHDEFFKFRVDTVEKTAVQSEILQHKQKVELPPLIEEYSKRKAYNENKNYYLLIHVI